MRTPAASSPEIADRMSRVRTTGTRPEIQLRRELHARGLRFRVDHTMPGIRSRADISFGNGRLAVYVDGCFWHGCQEHGVLPRANKEFWTAKLERNRRRDAEVTAALRMAGWEVIRIWEHEDPGSAADRVQAALELRRRSKKLC